MGCVIAAYTFRVNVIRMHGDLDSTLRVTYTCKDDSAVAGLDYEMNEVRYLI